MYTVYLLQEAEDDLFVTYRYVASQEKKILLLLNNARTESALPKNAGALQSTQFYSQLYPHTISNLAQHTVF